MPGMTPTQTLERQPPTGQESVASEGLRAIFGAARKIPARRPDQRTQAISVKRNQPQRSGRQNSIDHEGRSVTCCAFSALGVRAASRASRLSSSVRTRCFSWRSAGRRANGRWVRPDGSRSGAAGSCGTLTSCTLTLQLPDAPKTAAYVLAAWRCDSRMTRRIRLRTGEDGTSLRGMAIVSRGLSESTAARAATTK